MFTLRCFFQLRLRHRAWMSAGMTETRPLCETQPGSNHTWGSRFAQRVQWQWQNSGQGTSDQLEQVAQQYFIPPTDPRAAKSSAIPSVEVICWCYCTKHITEGLYRYGGLEFVWGWRIKWINGSVCGNTHLPGEWGATRVGGMRMRMRIQGQSFLVLSQIMELTNSSSGMLFLELEWQQKSLRPNVHSAATLKGWIRRVAEGLQCVKTYKVFIQKK